MQKTLVKRVIRKMRGGSQSSLVQNPAGTYLVAKWMGNPQGNRTLINECVYAALAGALDISTPPLHILELPEELRLSETVKFTSSSRSTAPSAGLHLGSECPVNLDEHAVWDFLPDSLLPKVDNLWAFGATFVLDRWTSQSDARQAIYFRNPDRTTRRGRYKVSMIDHGFAFNGTRWHLDSPSPTILPAGPKVGAYRYFDFEEVCRETIVKIDSIQEQELRTSLSVIPECWFAPGDAVALESLLDNLFNCRKALYKSVEHWIDRLKPLLREGDPACA